ncbi:MAG: hypothetical protein E6R09_00930 [Rhodocyclaceae bacterium]|nr:MAG: hypothetical protein E6R09_00930 [Rhodocyclaceae bacterium]
MIQAKKIFHLTAILLAASLYGCGPSVEDEVSKGIERDLTNRFRGFLVDPKVEITAFESNDSSVAPEYKSRFVAVMHFSEPTYEKTSSIKVGDDEWTILREKNPEGGSFKIYGNSTSSLRNEVIVTELSNLNSGDQVSGVRISDVPYGVVEGSESHKAITEEVQRLEELKQNKLAEIRKKLVGRWVGTYTCYTRISTREEAEYNFSLNIQSVSSDPNGYAFMVAGFADEQEPKALEFVLEGTLSEDGSFDINPTRWTHRVDDQGWTGFEGNLDEGSGELTGKVKDRMCKDFKLKRS